MEIMTWLPSYSQSVWEAALSANTGGTWTVSGTAADFGVDCLLTCSDRAASGGPDGRVAAKAWHAGLVWRRTVRR